MRAFLCVLILVATGLPAHAAAAPKAPPPPRAPTVPSADGVPIAYEVHGKGSPALVLVHGWSCDRSYWKEQVDDLSSEYQLVLIDLAGHGESGLGRKDYTMASFGDDVAAVVDSLKLEHVVLVGHSMGGDVIVEAAKRLPGKVVGLVWVDDYKSLSKPHSEEEVDAFVAKFRKDFRGTTTAFVRGLFGPNADPKLVDHVANDMASAPPAVALSALQNSFSYSREVTATLAGLKLPVVAINSDRDPTDYDSLQKYGVKAFVTPDSGHFLMLENPPRFNRTLDSVIRGFIAK